MKLEKIKEITEKILSKIFKFFRNPITNTRLLIGDTYTWLSDAFTNWDMEFHDFAEVLGYMFNKTIQFFYIIVDKIRYIIKEIQVIIGEMLKGFRGWS